MERKSDCSESCLPELEEASSTSNVWALMMRECGEDSPRTRSNQSALESLNQYLFQEEQDDLFCISSETSEFDVHQFGCSLSDAIATTATYDVMSQPEVNATVTANVDGFPTLTSSHNSEVTSPALEEQILYMSGHSHNHFDFDDVGVFQEESLSTPASPDEELDGKVPVTVAPKMNTTRF